MASRPKNLLAERLDRAISIRRTHPKVLSYSLIFILTALVITLKIVISWLSGESVSPFILMLPVVLFSAWFGGVRPGILSTVLTSVTIWYFFLAPYYSFAVTNVHRSIFLMSMYLIESLLVIGIVHRRNKAYEMMQDRIAQQAVVAAIGQHGLEEQNLDAFMDRVVHAISNTLDVKYIKILELLPDGKSLRVKSGAGWRRGVVRRISVPSDATTLAGYTLTTNKPVIVTDLTKEKRFSRTKLLYDHNIVSSISIVIAGLTRPYGTLSIHSDKKRIFTKEDVNFVRSLANVLSTTIERQVILQELELMANLNSRLVSSLDPKETLNGFSQLLVPKFADVCEIYLKTDKDSVELIDVLAVNKEKQTIFKEINKKYPPTDVAKRTTAKVFKSGRPIYYSVVPHDYPEMTGTVEGHVALIRKLGFQSLISHPLRIRNKTIGVLGLATFEGGRFFNERDFMIGKEVANRLAVAVDNAILYQDAKSAVSARDEFLSIASHELKTPLTSMLLQLQTVLHSMKKQSLATFSIEKTMEMLESTISQSKRLSKLVNDLLNISLITTGRLELEREKTNLVKVTKEVVSRLDGPVQKSGSSIVIDAKEAVIGSWDKIRIEQAITNLVTNAIKYGEGKPIIITISKDKNEGSIFVKDNGGGISKDLQQRIFNRFQRGDVKSSIQGLGVGLYLVNEIIKAHEGSIGLESKVGQGSTFSLHLPL